MPIVSTQDFSPPWFLRSGVLMTLYVAWITPYCWRQMTRERDPSYRSHRFMGYDGAPIHGLWAIPPQAVGTVIATYGITGSLDNQWYLKILGRKAYARQRAVLLFDWRAHGQTGQWSPALMSDGLAEGPDFVHLAAQAKALGCPPPYWFVGYSLGGQLALWGLKTAEAFALADPTLQEVGLESGDIGGAAVICPSLDFNRSLPYLEAHPTGRYFEQAIARTLKKAAWALYRAHPDHIDKDAVDRIHSIRSFDQELVIRKLGFDTVENYYAASSALPLLSQLQSPTWILYAKDDPLFTPELIAELEAIGAEKPNLEVLLTPYGGHVGYISRSARTADSDPWWAWNRLLDWIDAKT